MSRLILRWITAVLFIAAAGGANAQEQPPPDVQPLTLEQAIEAALANYPAVRAALAREEAARGGVSLARTSYLPRADMLWQMNRATRNNITGLLLPQGVIPGISGPVIASPNGESVWGSAAGLLFSWEAIDFGARRFRTDAARAGQDRTAAESEVTRLDVAVAVTEAYLTVLAAEQTVRAAQADVARREVLAQITRALAASELRPGADASRAEAELARARIGLVRAQQQEEISRAVLAERLGRAGKDVRVAAGPLLGTLPADAAPSPQPAVHPLAAAQRARVAEEQALVQAIGRSYLPRLTLQSAVFGRGSGANSDGTVGSGTDGLGLERGNWALGVTVSFSALDFFSTRARKEIEAANQKAEQARYDQTIQALTRGEAQARAALAGARRVADNTQVALEASRTGEAQARARYQAGLSSISEVADAQGLLAQAEREDALARLAVWHNLAATAAAGGNMTPFLERLREKQAGGR